MNVIWCVCGLFMVVLIEICICLLIVIIFGWFCVIEVCSWLCIFDVKLLMIWFISLLSMFVILFDKWFCVILFFGIFMLCI